MNKPVSPEVFDQWLKLECMHSSLILELRCDKNNLASAEFSRCLGRDVEEEVRTFEAEVLCTLNKLAEVTAGIEALQNEYKGEMAWSDEQGHFIKYF